MSLQIDVWLPESAWPSAEELETALSQDGYPISFIESHSFNRDGLFWPNSDEEKLDTIFTTSSGSEKQVQLFLETRRLEESDFVIDPEWGVNLSFIEMARDENCAPAVGDMFGSWSMSASGDWAPTLFVASTLVRHFKAGAVFEDCFCFNGDFAELEENARSWKSM